MLVDYSIAPTYVTNFDFFNRVCRNPGTCKPMCRERYVKIQNGQANTSPSVRLPDATLTRTFHYPLSM